MKTTLELMVDYLRGRGGAAALELGREMNSPQSAASQWLAALQHRTRGLIEADPPESPRYAIVETDRPGPGLELPPSILRRRMAWALSPPGAERSPRPSS